MISFAPSDPLPIRTCVVIAERGIQIESVHKPNEMLVTIYGVGKHRDRSQGMPGFRRG
jgi:hypothetical protein